MKKDRKLHIDSLHKIIKVSLIWICLVTFSSIPANAKKEVNTTENPQRQRISINSNWKFYRYNSTSLADKLIYDVRPEIINASEIKPADSKPTEAVKTEIKQDVLKAWILPTGNDFIKDPDKRYARPEGNPGNDFAYVQNDFDDSQWEQLNLPHDWAIKGPFYVGWDVEVGGGMGRLPSHGVAWYRKKIDIPDSDAGKCIFLEIDGAMSYAMVWLNGHLVGGWPYGYASWRVDLTPYITPGGVNQLAIRVDNPNHSARWYPGGGIYRNVWLTKTNPVHVGQWGAAISSEDISEKSAKINLKVTIDNKTDRTENIETITRIYNLDTEGKITGQAIATFEKQKATINGKGSVNLKNSLILKNPKLWGPPPSQKTNLYLAVTTIYKKKQIIDHYETRFGIRSIRFDPDSGVYVNDELIKIKGVNQHHDLGALGAAFNYRAAERQLEILRNMGCNAIRMSHNPPTPELLELCDRMGFLVINEIFDSWELKKTPHDFHLIFPDWYEQDTRAFIRRDRNCPSIIIWSIGNEVGEQYTGEYGAAIAKRLGEIVKEEDVTRLTTCAMNWAKPDMPLPAEIDVIGLNYQGEGIRQAPEFEGTERIRTAPQYEAYHAKFPDKVILSTETASAFSSRGIYLFPVTPEISSPVRDGRGGDSRICQVSAYELHAVDFGSSAEKVFGSLERHPFVAGEFVWTGWDHLGEPTPYYEARSSYCGIIDLAGFPKDRYFLYQALWRPEFPMAHILPHWNWHDRLGEVTPVHVFTSGDEAELFLNGKSLGRKKKAQYEFRLRWDSLIYEPGKLLVVVYKNGEKWAVDSVQTTNKPSGLSTLADRSVIKADGMDLTFITVEIKDADGLLVPTANNRIDFSLEGPGEIIATDNGDPMNFESFASHSRNAFNGLCLLVVRSVSGKPGTIRIKAKSEDLKDTIIEIQSE